MVGPSAGRSEQRDAVDWDVPGKGRGAKERKRKNVGRRLAVYSLHLFFAGGMAVGLVAGRGGVGSAAGGGKSVRESLLLAMCRWARWSNWGCCREG